MKAVPLARTKEVRDDGTIVEVVIWELPEPLPPSTHSFKYCTTVSLKRSECGTTTSGARAIIAM
jgi:hypothetical protein